MEFDYFCDLMDKLMSPSHLDKVLKLVLSIYDFNGDRVIDELDAYCFYYVYERENTETFMSLYFDDIIKIIARIQKKKVDRGFANREIDVKMKKIK